MSQMELTKEQIESLAKFVLEILDDCPDFGYLDGGDIQDLAEKHNLLIPQIVYEPCGENCSCAECYTDEEMQKGVTCYRIADWLARSAQQRNEAERAGAGTDPKQSTSETDGHCQECCYHAGHEGPHCQFCISGKPS